MAVTNNKGEFSVPLILTSTEDTQSVLKISVPGYESVTIIPFKGNGDVKLDLGVIFLNPKIKGLDKDKAKISRLNKDQIENLNKDKKDLKYYAQERLNKQIENLKTTLLPMVIGMVAQFGLTQAEELSKKSLKEIQDKFLGEGECPDQTKLIELIKKKNTIVKQLNNTLTLINSTTTSLGITSGIITTTQITLTAAENIPSIYNPTPPGVIKKLDKTLNSLTAINSGLLAALTLLRQVLKQVIDLLSLLDNLIQTCSPQDDVTNEVVSRELIELTQQQSNQSSPVVTNINGFEMGIETENTTNSLKRKRAIARNKQNIVMLKGEWSFSSIDQILIDELVFYIQQNNLKAE
jgi:hypothetical protein